MSSWAAFSSQVKAATRAQDGKHGGEGRTPPQRNDRSTAHEGRKATVPSTAPSSSTSSSFLDLKAELAHRHVSSAAEATSSQRRLKRGSDKRDHQDTFRDLTGKRDRTLPAHLRPSQHTIERSRRHDGRESSGQQLGATSAWASTPAALLDEAARKAAMERKVRMYELLQRGKTGGLDEDNLRESLIDWDRKEAEQAERSGGSESENGEPHDAERLHPRKREDAESDDPLTDYEDDLGRTRRVRRSEVPRQARRAQQRVEAQTTGTEELVTYGPATTFPVYRPDPTQRTEASASGYKRSAPDHFDAASFEKRYRGAGFYQFSQDEAERAQQMDELRRARNATMDARDQRADGTGGIVGDTNYISTDKDGTHALWTDLGEQRRDTRRREVEEKKKALLQRQQVLFGLDDDYEHLS